MMYPSEVRRLLDELNRPFVNLGFRDLHGDIGFLMKFEGMSYEQAFEALSPYMNERDFIDFQWDRGVPDFVSAAVFAEMGPRLEVPAMPQLLSF